MATMKTYRAKSLRDIVPIPVTIDAGTEGVHTFRVPRKQRQDVVNMLVGAVEIDPGTGLRSYPADVIRRGLIVLMATEIWEPAADTAEDGDVGGGRWVVVNDNERFIDLMNSPRVELETQTLGEILIDVIEELTGHPIGEPKP